MDGTNPQNPIMNTMRNLSITIAALATLLPLKAAEEPTYFFTQLSQLEVTKGKIPDDAQVPDRIRSLEWQTARSLGDNLFPYATGDNGETYYIAMRDNTRLNTRQSLASNLANLRIATQAPRGQIPSGTLYLPKPDWSGMTPVKFRIPQTPLQQETAKAHFLKTKIAHYQRLQNLRAAGTAWFRHQIQENRAQLDKIPADNRGDTNLNGNVGFRNNRNNGIDATYGLFSGGRAVSENLQLDRQLRIANNDLDSVSHNVDIHSIEGITIAEIDWDARIDPDKPVQPDTLAKAVPHDQHILLLPSFQNLLDLIDHSREQGTPILRLLEDRPEDALTQDRYQHQLCLPTDQLARLLGPKLIESVAITGSDTYLRTGSDLAVLFEAKDGNSLLAALQLRRQQIILHSKTAVENVSGQIEGTAYQGAISQDRSICAYLAREGNIVIATNSLVQLRYILETLKGKHASVASLKEYTWFRQRYSPDDDQASAFFLLTDATIRRWCGPRWRIAASRRTQAAAILSELQARQLSKTGLDRDAPKWIGKIQTTAAGPQSATYGNLAFLTPISELDMAKVSAQERTSYIRFRNRYQNRWRNFFDPIGGTLTVKDDKLAVDVSILPLIEGSEYNDLRQVTGDQHFGSDASTPTHDTLLHAIVAVDMKTRTMRQMGNFLSSTAPNTGTNALGWIGKWASVQLEDGPFWKDLAKIKRKGGEVDEYLEENFHRIPVIAKVDVRNPFKMTAFLAAFRTFLSQTSPGMLAWENRTYQEQTYVRIALSESARREMRESAFRNFALHYRVQPGRLTLTLGEEHIKAEIDRSLQTHAEDAEDAPAPQPRWVGQSLGLRLTADSLPHIQNLFQDNLATALQWRCWNNLHILNEWRREHGAHNALDHHEKTWHTRLTCPGGGQYQWNDKFQTYESTIFGHPARPKSPDILQTSPLANLQEISLGLTFEDDGLRARTEILRKPKVE